MNITVRDGTPLDVDECLMHTRAAIDGWAARDHSPATPVLGMALALEAALLRVRELEQRREGKRKRQQRRWW